MCCVHGTTAVQICVQTVGDNYKHLHIVSRMTCECICVIFTALCDVLLNTYYHAVIIISGARRPDQLYLRHYIENVRGFAEACLVLAASSSRSFLIPVRKIINPLCHVTSLK